MSKSEKAKNTRFIFTGGHLTPALAVIAELQKRGYSDIHWIGRKKTMRGDENVSVEFQKVSQELQLPFYNYKTGKIIRFDNVTSFFDFLANLIILPVGFIRALFLLLKSKPDIVVSFGGHLAVPIVIVAKILGIPAVTHEQTVVRGLANTLIGRFVDKVLISWAQSYKFFSKEKTVLTGNPIRKEVLQTTTDAFDLTANLRTIYVTGGNQGAHIINTNIFAILDDLLDEFNVIHQTGSTTVTNDFFIAKKKSKQYQHKRGTYTVKDNIFGKEIGEVFSKADIVISRCGANTLTELLALGKFSILVPIPWAIHDEQTKNAKLLQKVGLGKLIAEKNLSEKTLRSAIHDADQHISEKIGFNNKPLQKVRNDAQEMVHFDAAVRIVDVILSVVKS